MMTYELDDIEKQALMNQVVERARADLNEGKPLTEMRGSRLTVTFDVDRKDFEVARRIMTKLTKEEDESISLPLSDEQVAYTLYLYGIDNYFECYGEDEQ